MSVSNYTPGNGCSYSYSKLRDRIYLVSEDHVKKIYIDNGEAYISGLTETPLVIEGFNIDFKEESSLDERYKFQKTLTISKKGYASFKDFQGKYYAIIETIDGTFYMINVDFPSKITHVFNLSKDTNQTDFTFTSLSNYPTLKINYDFGSIPYECKGFNVSGIKGLKLCERIRTDVSTVNSTIYTYGDTTGVNERSFRTIEYLGESCTFQEAYDGVNVTDTITFDIGFDAYKTSWQYNLLEFVENLYSAIIESKGEEDIRYYSGFNHGLEPSYSIAANNGDKQSDIITITLVEASNSGLFRVDEMTVTNDNSKSWRWIRKYGNHNTYECLEPGVAMYLVKEEVWANGTPTGRYMVMEGYEDEFYYLNIVGTFDDEVTFYQPECTCNNGKPIYNWDVLPISEEYDCDTAATKYYKEAQVVSYDCGETWEQTGEYRRGSVYEYNSADCGYAEKWVQTPITDGYICDECIYRVVSGTPYCDGYDKYVDVSYQVYNGESWVTTATTSTLLEHNSEYCGAEHDYSQDYLTIHASPISNNRLYVKALSGDVYVSIDGGEWEHIANYSRKVVSSGQVARIKGTNGKVRIENETGSWTPSQTSYFETYGNVMSLFYGDNFTGKTAFPSSGITQNEMYSGCTGLTSAENLILPATTVYKGQYAHMFQDCTALTKAPKVLPATTLASYGYVPGTVNYGGAYLAMFQGCTSLTTVPIIAASNYHEWACSAMFQNCTALTTLPSNLFVQSINNVPIGCFIYMFDGCTNLKNAPSLKANSIEQEGCAYMYRNCESLSAASFTIGNSVGESACTEMFSSHSIGDLSNIKLKPTTLAKDCYKEMFRGTYLTISGNTTLTSIPSGFLPATTLAENCYYSMFSMCTALSSVPSNLLPATTLAKGCYSNMFAACSFATAPDLPATVLVESCYEGMFGGNNQLNYIKCLATDVSANNCTSMWITCYGVAGTFVKNSSMNNWSTGCERIYGDHDTSNGIPDGWSVQNA